MEGNKLLKISKIIAQLDSKQAGDLVKAVSNKVLGYNPEKYITQDISALYLLTVYTLGLE